LRRADDAVAAAAEVHVAVGTRRAGVRGRPQLADQAELVERGLELRAGDAPLDPFERAERRLDRGPLAVGAEVGAEARAQVARAADVQHLVVRVPEEVDAGPLRGAEGEVALALRAARPRGRELDEVADRGGAALLREPD